MNIKSLFSLFIAFSLCHTSLCAQPLDKLNEELFSEYETEFWINGNYSYVHETLKLFIDDPFFKEQMECEERALVYLYSGLSRIYQSDISNQTKDYLEQACQLAIEAYGENSRMEGLALTGLGRWSGSRDVKEAITYDKRAYDILSSACGQKSFEAAIAGQGLAYHFTLAGSLEEAERMYDNAANSYETAGLCESLMYIRFLTERALLWTAKRAIQKAMDDLNQSVKLLIVFDEQYNKDETDIVPMETYIYHLSIAQYVHIMFGLYEKAQNISKQCLDLMDTAGLSQTTDYAANLANLGAIYIYLKDKEKAIECYKKAKALYDFLGATDNNGYNLTVKTLDWLLDN